MTKKIVLINQHPGYLFGDVVNAFASEYDEVVFMAGKVPMMNDALNEKIKLHKIFPYNRTSTLKRFYSWIACTIHISWLLVFKYRKYDLLISSNPPTASTLLPIFFKRKISILMYDIYPDGLIAGSFVTKKNIIYSGWARLNKLAYKKVKSIIALTKGMALALEEYADKEKGKKEN